MHGKRRSPQPAALHLLELRPQRSHVTAAVTADRLLHARHPCHLHRLEHMF